MEYGFHPRPPQPDPYAEEKRRMMEFIAQPQVQALGLGLFGGAPGLAARTVGLALPLLGTAAKATRFLDADPAAFVAQRAKVPDKFQPFLTPHSAEELESVKNSGGQVRLSQQGDTGYVLSPTGDLQNVFNIGERGRGQLAVKDANRRGVQSGDAFAGHLPNVYKQHGQYEVDRLPFDPQYAPQGWESNEFLKTRPDVVMMKRDAPFANIQRMKAYNHLLDIKDALEYGIGNLSTASPVATENVARAAQLPMKAAGHQGR